MTSKTKVVTVSAVILLLVGGAVAALNLMRSPGAQQLTLDANPVRQGGQVHVSGRGFLPLEPVSVAVTRQGTAGDAFHLREAGATTQGDLDAAYVALPDDLQSGAHVLRVVGQVSGRESSTVIYVRAKAPWLTLASGEVKPHGKLGLIVGGFDPGERVLVSLTQRQQTSTAQPSAAGNVASRPSNLASLSTDRVGNSAWSEVKIPLVNPGDYTIVARGQSSGQELKKNVSVTAYHPTLELSPWAGPPGTKIQLNSRGFEPGEKIRIYLGSGPGVAGTVVADTYGNFWGAGSVRVPYDALPGELAVKVVGEDSNAQTTATYRVLKPKPWLELTQYWGAPGGSVEFSGGGWAGGERIAFHVGSAKNPTVAYGRADDFGWLHNAGPATIPKDAYYQVTFVAVGEDSHSVATATFKIVLPFGIRPGDATPEANVTVQPTP